jgi:hypothetical protein
MTNNIDILQGLQTGLFGSLEGPTKNTAALSAAVNKFTTLSG